MDSGKLPAYRSSYLLRHHPYPRTRLSPRERIALSVGEDPFYNASRLDALYLALESDVPLALNQAIHGTHIELRQRRLSISSLVVDLALMCIKRPPVQSD